MLLAAATEADKLNLDISLGTWAILGAVIAVMLLFDLFVYARGHIPSVRENLLWSIGWILVALAFGAVFWPGRAARPAPSTSPATCSSARSRSTTSSSSP